VEKQSILKLVRAAKALAQSPEFQTHKTLHGWILRIEDEQEQIVALVVDAWKVDTLAGEGPERAVDSPRLPNSP
jgi:hypothetical protein